jgi:hypothetical protein
VPFANDVPAGNPLWDYIKTIIGNTAIGPDGQVLTGSIPTLPANAQNGNPFGPQSEGVPGGNTAPGSDANNTGTTPGSGAGAGSQGTTTTVGGDFPWSSSKYNNPTYPYALWGGEDNFKAQQPPDWLKTIVADALAMPDGPDKTKRIQHIIGSTTGPDYITNYLHSVFAKGQYW